jgi:hypothetical protein
LEKQTVAKRLPLLDFLSRDRPTPGFLETKLGAARLDLFGKGSNQGFILQAG